jgi:hypothetical protein
MTLLRRAAARSIDTMSAKLRDIRQRYQKMRLAPRFDCRKLRSLDGDLETPEVLLTWYAEVMPQRNKDGSDRTFNVEFRTLIRILHNGE